jgi:hypothetical protein
MGKLMRHGRLALLLVVGVVGIVGATLLVAIGAPAPTPDATTGQVGEVITPQSDDGIQVAQVTTTADTTTADKPKCTSKPCPKVRRPAN